MADLTAPPTFAEVVLVDQRTKKATFNPIWLSWFLSISDTASSVVTAHNALTGIQGGAANDHFHLTAVQHALAAAYAHNSLNGLQGGAAGGFYHLTQAEHTLAVAYDHEDMNGLLGGAANAHFHLTAAQHATATGGPAAAATAIVLGASPATWQNTTGFNVVITANGAAADAYALSRDNVTFRNFGVGASLCLVVPRGDYLKATFAGAAPTLHYYAM